MSEDREAKEQSPVVFILAARAKGFNLTLSLYNTKQLNKVRVRKCLALLGTMASTLGNVCPTWKRIVLNT